MLAMIWSSPPIASMILLKVLMYMSERRGVLSLTEVQAATKDSRHLPRT